MKLYMCFKTIIDIISAAFLSLALLPVFIILVIAIKVDSQGDVIFKQRRIGKGKKEFYILKFRTMKIETPSNIPTHMLNNPEYYITRVGKFLRKSSLDELPQLFNVLKGEMSFVGPRPALWNQYDLIEARDKLGANDVKPGITGLAQVNGRDELPIEIKAKYDGEYAANVNLFMDIRIILKTLLNVVLARGIKEGTGAKTNNNINL